MIHQADEGSEEWAEHQQGHGIVGIAYAMIQTSVIHYFTLYVLQRVRPVSFFELTNTLTRLRSTIIRLLNANLSRAR